MSASSLALDDAAWDSRWRQHRCSEKVLLTGGLVLTALVLPPWPAAALVSVTALVLMLAFARTPVWTLVAVAGPALVFVLVGAATIAVTVGPPPEAPLWAAGPVSVSASGLVRAASVAAHGTAGTLAVLLLATTTPLVDLLAWLHRWGVPQPLLDVAAGMYRLVFVLLTTLLTVHQAQVNRLGHDPGAGGRSWDRPWRTTAALVGVTWVRAWDRAVRLQAGLALRGGDADQLVLARPATRSLPLLATALVVPAVIVACSVLLPTPGVTP